MPPGRNDPCPCGSGRKYKKCCLATPSKQRTTSVTMNMGEPTIAKGYSMSSSGGVVLFGEDGKPLQHDSATVERSYDRPKGPKILSKVFLDERAELVADIDTATLQFDTIFAVDSNSKRINGRDVWVAAITLCRWQQRHSRPVAEFAPTQAMEFRDVDCSPDLLALKRILLEIQKTPGIAAGRIGIVLDSHLGDLPKIEGRMIPLLDQYFLPTWAGLIYASDSASDCLPNKLLRASDKAATSLLRKIETGDWREESPESFFDDRGCFRVWNL